jgi:hypothetical protein
VTAQPGAADGAVTHPALVAALALRPGPVADAGARLAAAAEGLSTAAAALGAPLQGWSGGAATAAASRLGERVAALRRAASAFADAGAALSAHAATLEEARAAATALRARAEAADERVSRATALGAAAGADPALAAAAARAAEGERAGVGAAAARLVDEVGAGGAAAARALRAAAAAAPPRPGWHTATADAVDGALTSAAFGAGEAVVGLVRLPAQLAGASALRLAVDPAGYLAGALRLRAAASAAAADPRGAALAALDVELWREDPARAVGRLLPELVASAVGAGGAAAVARGANGVRAAGAASAVGRRAPERADDAGGPWAGHGLGLSPAQAAEARALAARAAAVEPQVTARVTAVADAVAARTLGLEHRLKGLDSLQRKIAEELLERPDVVAVVDTVNDTLRFTLELDDARYAAGAVAAMRGLRAGGLVPVAWKNFWTRAKPYQGLNTTWAAPGSPVLLEVQVHSPASWAANKDTRADYEVQRVTANPPALRAAAAEAQAQRWALVPRPPRVEVLTADLVGLRPATPEQWRRALTAPAGSAGLLLASPVPVAGDQQPPGPPGPLGPLGPRSAEPAAATRP